MFFSCNDSGSLFAKSVNKPRIHIRSIDIHNNDTFIQMKTAKIISAPIILFFVLLAYSTGHGQTYSQSQNISIQPLNYSAWDNDFDEGSHFLSPFMSSVTKGLQATMTRVNIGFLAAFLATETQQKWRGISVPPSSIDREISFEVSRADGRKSFGAISPKYYPSIAGAVRLAGVSFLDILGVRHASASTYEKLFRFHLAIYFNKAVTHIAKRNLNRQRPDGTDTQSLYSGHTSTVFATSTYLYLEMHDWLNSLEQKDRLLFFSAKSWKKISAAALYGWAGYVGYTRIYDGKHYPSDVIIGALAGSLVSYLVYPHESQNTTSPGLKVNVYPTSSFAGLGLNLQF